MKIILAILMMSFMGCAHGYYASDVGARVNHRDGKAYKVYRCHYRYHCQWRVNRYGKMVYECSPNEHTRQLCDYDR